MNGSASLIQTSTLGTDYRDLMAFTIELASYVKTDRVDCSLTGAIANVFFGHHRARDIFLEIFLV